MPGTDYVRDREASNLCEEFIPLASAPPSQHVSNNKAKWIFGEEPPKKKNPLLDEETP